VTTTIDQIAAALADAQLEMKNPGFDATNPHFKNRFATLAAVRNAVIPVLAKHGIAVSQDLTTEGGGISCCTLLLHSSGQSLSFGPLSLPASKADAQGFGSAATYARRYSLMAVAGVVGDDDDDGNKAVETVPLVDPAKVKQFADEYRLALALDVQEEDKAEAVYAIHMRLTTDDVLYPAVGDTLTAKERSAIKAYVAQAKEARKAEMLPTGRGKAF
jgi:hypothetical protein